MKMLYVYNRCGSRFPLQRLIFTGAVASVFVVFILYIALNHANDLNNKIRQEKMIKTMDYNVNIIKLETKNLSGSHIITSIFKYNFSSLR